MTNDGWQEADYRELELAERFNMVINEKQFDEVFGSRYYNEADLSEFEKAAEQRWQEFTGGVR